MTRLTINEDLNFITDGTVDMRVEDPMEDPNEVDVAISKNHHATYFHFESYLVAI